MKKENINAKRGYFYSVASAVIFGVTPLIAKMIYARGGNAISLVFYRFFLPIPILYIAAIKTGCEDMRLSISDLKKLLIIVLGYSATPLLLYSSYNYISVGAASTLHFTYPVFIMIGLACFYKLKPKRIELISVIIAMIGIFMIMDIDQLDSFIGFTLAFVSGITYAVYSFYLDKSGLNRMNIFKICFYMAILSSFIVLVFSLLTQSFVYSFSLETWVLTFGFAVSISVIAVVFYQMGIKLIGSQKTSILSTFEPLTSIVLGLVFFSEVLTLQKSIAIICIITASVLLAVFGGDKKLKADNADKLSN